MPPDEGGHERARWDDALSACAGIVEREPEELLAEPPAPERRLDLGVEEVHKALSAAIRELAHRPAVDGQLVPAELGVVDDAAQQPSPITARFAMPFGRPAA